LFDQVVSQLLDGVGALTGLNLIVVNTNEDGLAGLDANNTSGTLKKENLLVKIVFRDARPNRFNLIKSARIKFN
jgi:hypothetical protein